MKKKTIIIMLISFVLLIGIGFTGNHIYNAYQEKKENEEILQALNEYRQAKSEYNQLQEEYNEKQEQLKTIESISQLIEETFE